MQFLTITFISYHILTDGFASSSVIATSGPSSTYPQRAYRNPTDALVKFLDYKHGANWAIWEFRAEGTGYPDSEVHGRIRHYPWPDHHPPPFALIPNIMASMRNWLKASDQKDRRVVVVHCKAGKGRSGTVACSYLISEEGWTVGQALTRFTERRMRSGFGAGVSIPSQVRWIDYVDRWTKQGKVYVERQIEVLEVHVWGLRDGVKVAIEGFVDEGRTIKTFHIFRRDERIVIDGTAHNSGVFASLIGSNNERGVPPSRHPPQLDGTTHSKPTDGTEDPFALCNHPDNDTGAGAVIFRPSTRVVLPTNDINIDFERRNKATYGWTMVTSVAHVWFNAFFESSSLENNNKVPSDGVFDIEWDAMDGIKGSSRKGIRALDRLAVVWRALDSTEGGLTHIITEPVHGEPVPQSRPADWKGAHHDPSTLGKDLGLRTESPISANVSKANSVQSIDFEKVPGSPVDEPAAGVRAHGPQGEEHILHPDGLPRLITPASQPIPQDHTVLGGIVVGSPHADKVEGSGLASVAGVAGGRKGVSTGDLPGGRAEGEMETSRDRVVGQVVRDEDTTTSS